MLRLVILVVASLLAGEVIIRFAAAADAGDAGTELPAGSTFASGIVIAMLYLLGGLGVLGRPGLAALLFVLAGAAGVLVGSEDGAEGLTTSGVVALSLAVASAVCARWRLPPGLAHGRDG